MKKIFTILVAVLLTANVFAQSPEKMSYQAVVRDASNNLVTNQIVGMQISILQGSAGGSVVYTENQTPTTNDNGLISIEIGGGTGFDTINWASGPYFIKTETDPTGGSTYTITGTSQLLSVPYAFFSSKSDTANISLNSYWLLNGTKLHYNSGNIGIGNVISNPSNLLSINPYNGTRDGIEFRDQNSSNYGMKILYDEPGNQLQVVSNNNGETDVMTIKRGSGYVGIGTTSPARTLHVNSVLRLEPVATPPTSPSEGDMYMDSTTHKLMVFDGTQWQACW